MLTKTGTTLLCEKSLLNVRRAMAKLAGDAPTLSARPLDELRAPTVHTSPCVNAITHPRQIGRRPASQGPCALWRDWRSDRGALSVIFRATQRTQESGSSVDQGPRIRKCLMLHGGHLSHQTPDRRTRLGRWCPGCNM